MSAQLRTRQELKLQKFNNIDCVALDAIGQGYKGIQAYMDKVHPTIHRQGYRNTLKDMLHKVIVMH